MAVTHLSGSPCRRRNFLRVMGMSSFLAISAFPGRRGSEFVMASPEQQRDPFPPRPLPRKAAAREVQRRMRGPTATSNWLIPNALMAGAQPDIVSRGVWSFRIEAAGEALEREMELVPAGTVARAGAFLAMGGGGEADAEQWVERRFSSGLWTVRAGHAWL